MAANCERCFDRSSILILLAGWKCTDSPCKNLMDIQPMFLSKNHLSAAQAASPTCVVTGTKTTSKPQENILLWDRGKKNLTCFNLHFICFTFSSKHKAQTLAGVPPEPQPQGRNISLDKHLEEKSWQDAPSQKKKRKKKTFWVNAFPACVQPASQQPPLSAHAGVPCAATPWRPCLSFFFCQKPAPDKHHGVRSPRSHHRKDKNHPPPQFHPTEQAAF